MKNTDDITTLPSGSDFNDSGSELSENQGIIAQKHEVNYVHLLENKDLSDMSEAIRRWESIRYI